MLNTEITASRRAKILEALPTTYPMTAFEISKRAGLTLAITIRELGSMDSLIERSYESQKDQRSRMLYKRRELKETTA